MNQSSYEEEIGEAKRRAEEARRAWRQARDEMRHAFRRARSEQKEHWRQQGPQDETDESIQEMAETAREFAGEVAEEARRFADELWKGARHDFGSRWREQWRHSFGKDWQSHWVFGGRRFRQWAAGDEEANPFVAAILSRGGGLLALYVLHLLGEQPRHGNEIMKQIEQRTLGSWSSNPGAIYPLLSFMEEKGLVQSRWEDPDKRTRRIYQITDEGRRELERLRGVLRPKVMEAIEVLHVLYDDLYESGEATTGDSPSGEESPAAPSGGEPAAAGDGSAPGEGPVAESAQSAASEAPATEVGGSAEFGWRRRLGRLFGGGSQASAFGV